MTGLEAAAKRRRGAARVADVPPGLLARLERGEAETATLAETLAIDLGTLLMHAVPELGDAARAGIDPTAGITRRMAQAAALARQALGPLAFPRLLGHPADTVRGWAAFVLALDRAEDPGRDPREVLKARLERIRPLADDPHFGVREWAWLALRPAVAAAPESAVAALAPWTGEASANLRRFAVEITRPRGVWCAHIAALKAEPDLELPLLEPLRSDPARYVQDSVANWINDAAKARPDWALALAARWRTGPQNPETARILTRALRSL